MALRVQMTSEEIRGAAGLFGVQGLEFRASGIGLEV